MQRLLTVLGPLPFMALAIFSAGCALGVAIFVFELLSVQIAGVSSWLRYPLLGVVVAASYFAYGLSLLLIAPAINFVMGGRLQPYRGSVVSLAAMRWYVHCTMTLLKKPKCWPVRLCCPIPGFPRARPGRAYLRSVSNWIAQGRGEMRRM